VIGRVLVCTSCRSEVQVLEAATGARTEAEHRWIDPETFVCGGCLAVDDLPAEALEAVRRAETAHREASWREKSERIERSAKRRMEGAAG
jgi:hypothetical protein